MTDSDTGDGLPPLRDVIAENGLDARKSLGQHFLLDLNLTRRIARAAGDLSQTDVVEVGPGPGGLTRALLMEGARKVIAIERDHRCRPVLDQIADAYPGRVEMVEADALEVDEASLVTRPARLVANLPYNVSTTLLIKWLTATPWKPWYEDMTLMFQKEVAERIVAPPGSRTYGRLSVMSQWRCEAAILFDVSPKAFTPPPKVMSSIVKLVPKEMGPDDPSVAAMERLTAAAFGQRRKMLRAALKGHFPKPEETLAAAGLEPTARAETLSVDDFRRLARIAEKSA